MTTFDRNLTVETRDRGQMPAYVAMPRSGRGPGLVLLQEIFGVTEYIRSRASDLAALGYVTVVPELYWRLGPNIVTDEQTEAGLQEAFGYFSRLDLPQAVDDAVATLAQVRAMPETGGRAGVMGFCLGGRLAYEVGVAADPVVVVSYYGSGIADRLVDAGQLTCPACFQFGEADPYLSQEQAAQIERAFANHPAAEFHAHGGGHAFDNFRAPIFYHQPAADAAWPQTTAFLAREYPVDSSA